MFANLCVVSIGMSQKPILEPDTNSGTRGLQPELLDPKSELDAQKCTHNSIRSQLHADILFLSIRPLIIHAEMPFGQALKSNMEKTNHIDLIFENFKLAI